MIFHLDSSDHSSIQLVNSDIYRWAILGFWKECYRLPTELSAGSGIPCLQHISNHTPPESHMTYSVEHFDSGSVSSAQLRRSPTEKTMVARTKPV